MDRANKRETGRQYEQKAAAFLKEKGYNIIKKNYYCRYGEIDIIAEENGYIVFIEVKYRKNNAPERPLEAVDSAKRKRIWHTALDYLIKNYGTEEIQCRFDVVAITENQVYLVKDAFQA